MPLPTLFHLKQKGKLLAVLDLCRAGDEMFWVKCRFEPTEAFSPFRPLFEQASGADDELFNQIYDQFREAGMLLVDVADQVEIIYFVLHIDGDQVDLRYADPRDLARYEEENPTR